MPQKEIDNSFKIKVTLFCSVLFLFSSLFTIAEAIAIETSTESELNFSESSLLRKVKRDTLVVKTSDSVTYYTRGVDGLIIMPPSDWEPFPYDVRFRDTVIYNPAYLPVVFDGKILPSNLDFRSENKPEEKAKRFHLIPAEETLAPEIKKMQDAYALRRSYYTNMNNISKVRYSAGILKTIPKLDEDNVTKRNVLHDLITAEEPIKVEPIALPKADVEYIYWLKNGEHSLQFSQNYISENWHKGGNSSYIIRNYHKFTLNYKKDKVTFDNLLEWKLNLQRVNNAEKHGTNISDDLLRMENVFGYKAFNNWSYSVRMEAKATLFNNYPVDGDKKNTAFLSPLIINPGIGMNYLIDKKFADNITKKLKLTLNIAPLSLRYVYLNDIEIIKREGVPEGDRSKMVLGSNINANLTFSFNRYTTWTSRFAYFTDYDNTQMELENKFDMALNRYLSTTVYLYARFDDNAEKAKAPLNYFQINQMLSFGLTYKW